VLPGPDIIIACPKCSAPHRLPTLASGNTSGATLWTDGFMDAPMLPSTPVANQCHACKDLFWVADAPQLGEIEFGEVHPRDQDRVLDEATASAWRSAREVRHLTKDQYYRALDSEMVTSEERERQLRTHAWHASNAARRKSQKAVAPDDRDRRNMERLLELNRAFLCEAALFAAELSREMGRWDEVMKFLSVPFPEGMEEVAARILELAGARVSRVAHVRRK
jgi:hypothetical protein